MTDHNTARRRTRRSVILATLAIAAAIGALAAFKFILGPMMVAKFMAGRAEPPVTVSTAVATLQPWQARREAVGTLVAVNGVDVTAETAGIVATIQFAPGDDVAAGAALVRLNDEVQQAELKQNLALLKDANLELERSQSLATRGNVSQATLDTARARRDQAAAAVERTRAVIAQKNIRAPFAGRLGVRLVNIGEYLAAGTAMVTLQALDPLFVNFTLPEQALAQLTVGQTVEVAVDAFPGAVFTGTITAIDAKVEASTRNVLVQATLPNPDHRLVPGMFAAVAVLTGAPAARVTIPETAVSFSLYGDFVYVATPTAGDGLYTVERRTVTVGDREAGRVAISKGVEAGEAVVSAGQIKLRPGATVRVDNARPLTPASPRPRL